MCQLMFKKLSKAVLEPLIDCMRAAKYTGFLMLVGLGMAAGTLAGCGATLPSKVLPPVELLQDCPESPIDTTTNGGLAKAIPILRHDIAVCNADKAALRQWAGDSK